MNKVIKYALLIFVLFIMALYPSFVYAENIGINIDKTHESGEHIVGDVITIDIKYVGMSSDDRWTTKLTLSDSSIAEIANVSYPEDPLSANLVKVELRFLKAGRVTLYAEANNNKDKISLNCQLKHSDFYTIKIYGNQSMKVGESLKVSATIKKGNEVVNGEVKFLSSNNDVLTVASDGTVKAKAVGKAYVTAQYYAVDDTIRDEIEIEVLDGEKITIVDENTVQPNTIRTYPQGNSDDTVAKVNLPNVGNQEHNVQSSKIFFIVFSILFFAVYLYSFIKMIKDFKK